MPRPRDCLTEDDCRWYGKRLARMDAARPPGVLEPHEFPGHDEGRVDKRQLIAFEQGVERWWLVVPPGPNDVPDGWHYAE
ncbi:hypothetical protein [Novosphingobium sp. Gsoil 351]|uniref:hypothetical protein n=1 Tax=Novosphingobium sp. Gsoil 351 TaxID=2675225 RepID=UPI0012B4BF3F|nr:hypothetical protein [Novosphingobium sp. Gsoil 351]QGN54248.1 hypothetical protein GKE62_06495 [Novosphingobium sp. Gsoil 351]